MSERAQSRTQRVLSRVCPHWYWPIPNYGNTIMMEVTKRERCRICGKHRIHARVPEPHPTRDKQALLEEINRPGHELVVEEWVPYGERP